MTGDGGIYRHLDSGLSQLNRQLLTMAGLVEQAVEHAIEAWRLRSFPKIQEVHAIERKVNRANIEVDDACVKLIALQQPMAADLRSIIAIIKINSELERMVDLAVNIAMTTEHFLKMPPRFRMDDLDRMADEVRVMVQEVLDAFVRMDNQLARDVLERDDTVDAYKRKIFDDAVTAMKGDPDAIDQGLTVILVARNLERIGDHATNIAEDVIYIHSGEDVRHASQKERR